MLYISRIVDADPYSELNWGSYGIVDTDDGVETIVSHNDILKMVDLGLKIAGVNDELFGKFSILSTPVVPYQDKQYAIKDYTKLQVMRGVTINRFKSQITAVSAQKKRDTDYTIRLSDFGLLCSAFIFKPMRLFLDPKPVVIIDDKIGLHRLSLLDFHRRVVLDIREVRNENIIENIIVCLLRDIDAGYFVSHGGLDANDGCLLASNEARTRIFYTVRDRCG